MFTADLDVGGTFTDGFFTRGGEARTAKVLTTPHDVTVCLVSCLNEGANAFGVAFATFLREMSIVRLSTTLATNTLVEGKGARVGLIVSRGAEESLYRADGSRVSLSILPPEMIAGIHAGADRDGRFQTVEGDEVLAAVRGLIQRGARIIAVSLRGAWRDPRSESEVRRIVEERYPQHYLRSIPLQLGTELVKTASDEVRTDTVVLNCYLHRTLASQMYKAEDTLRQSGFRRPLLAVHSTGGTARIAQTIAVQTIASGPAAAVAAASRMLPEIGVEAAITSDMGGTSFDYAAIRGGAPPVLSTVEASGMRIGVPALDVRSVAAGGGTIAWLDDSRRIRVGPQSAGGYPGPACYAKGGLEPTVTDADLVLGYLDARFRQGRMKLDRQSAQKAIEVRIAEPLKVAVVDAAIQIRSEIDQTMASAIRSLLAQRGIQPERVALLSFGGAGPIHACSIAEGAGITRIVAFPFSSVFSAYGSSALDVVHHYADVSAIDSDDSSARKRLRAQAIRDMKSEGFDEREVEILERSEIEADAGSKRLAVTAVGIVSHWSLPRREVERNRMASTSGFRSTRWSASGDFLQSATYDARTLLPGVEIVGPALIDGDDTSYAVAPGWRCFVDAFGFYQLRADPPK